ncbi:general secretion pathway protein GspK [Ruficoccus amylovorans]|uniref:General secretion pathway protein GspK n=1 Tax=Ruficoccus amylovorans TaxID=1804625 RepID=A0A842HKV0_9BACT|nr:type II secretion system protein GspK [Ruficoccus amylovorans]MBC2596156.1 general secretion pathway protein GspK [Ruficoccus amylovorans]
MFSTTRQQRKRRGVVIVLALGMILLMTWLALEILRGVRQDLAVTTSPVSRTQLRETAYQLLEVSIGVLAEVKRFEGGIYSPSQGWGLPLTYAGMAHSAKLKSALPQETPPPAPPANSDDELGFDETEQTDTTDTAQAETDEAESFLNDLVFDVENAEAAQDGFERAVTQVEPSAETTGQMSAETALIELPPGIQARVRLFDESGKLSLTDTSEARWLLFFEQMGFEDSESKTLTDSLLDWIDPDEEERENGAETETYAQLDPPYRSANRPLRDFRELRYVQGFKTLFFDERGVPNEYYNTFKANVSLFGKGEVNFNTASELVLLTLAEERDFDPDQVLTFLAGTDTQFGTEDDRILRPGLDDSELPKDNDGNVLPANRSVNFIIAEIAVSDGQSIYVLNALLDLTQKHPGGTYPFRIVRITENQPLF